MAKCRVCGAPVSLAPDGDPKYELPWRYRHLEQENERLRGQRDTLCSAVDEFLRFPIMDALPKLSAAFAQVRRAAADEAVGKPTIREQIEYADYEAHCAEEGIPAEPAPWE